MIGYKATDMNGCCRGFKFEVGKTYTKDTKAEDLQCCTDTGFHFCRELFAIEKESNYSLSESRLFEVIAGDYKREDDKYITNSLTILREITGKEKKELCNSGNKNSGYHNSGDWNSGDRNSGDWNSGDLNSGNRNSGDGNSGYYNSGNRNSGNRNSGNWNSGNRNSGYFNSDTPFVRMFNKDTELTRGDLSFPSWLYFDLTVWVSHDTATAEEKKKYKAEIETCGGFLKAIPYKQAFSIAYNKAPDEEKLQLFNLPNFDTGIFEEISGIDVTADFKRLKGEQK